MNSLLEKTIVLVGIYNQQLQGTIFFNGRLDFQGLVEFRYTPFVDSSHIWENTAFQQLAVSPASQALMELRSKLRQ